MFNVTRGMGRLARALGLLAVLAAFAFGLLGTSAAPAAAKSAPPAASYIVVQIKDADTGAAVAQGLISITTKDGIIVAQGKTDTTGYIKFLLPSNSYYVVVEAPTYRDYRVGVALAPHQVVQVGVALNK